MKKQIAILGSTGSIGTQALQVIEEHPDLYEAYALTANNRVDLLIEQARKFLPEAVVIANEEKYLQLKEALSDLPIKVYAGADALCQIVESQPIDIVLASMVGYAGLRPTMNAIKAGTDSSCRFGTFGHFPVSGNEYSCRKSDIDCFRRAIPYLYDGAVATGD